MLAQHLVVLLLGLLQARASRVSQVVCACVRVVFCGVLVRMKCGSMLIFLACWGQQIPTLLMALHHVLVCVCVFCDVCKHLCGCQGVVCVRVCARMNCVFELICFFLCSSSNSSQECAVSSGVCVCACVCVWCRGNVCHIKVCVCFWCVGERVCM